MRRRLKAAVGIARRRRQIGRYLAAHREPKLQLGAGEHPLVGWLNTDLHDYGRPGELVYLDVREPFPLPDTSFDLVYSEHMLEHLSYTEGQRCLRECFRVLRPGGRIRIATPSLERLARLYDGGAVQERYVHWAAATLEPELRAPLPGAVVNNFFRSWGHRFIYDPQTLRHALAEAGFVDVVEQSVGELEQHLAEAPEFNEFETIVFEGQRPQRAG
jgi:predicted SAM-dependent methyltransferase